MAKLLVADLPLHASIGWHALDQDGLTDDLNPVAGYNNGDEN
jgi:hypothetical protein